MSKTIAPVKNSLRHVSLLTSIRTKLTLIVVAPAILLGAVAIGAQSYSGTIADRAIDDIVRTNDHGLELAGSAQEIGEVATQFKDDLVAFTQRHQHDLLKNSKPSDERVADGLKAQTGSLLALVDRDLASLRNAMTTSIEPIESKPETSALFDKRYHFVVRSARNLPRLLGIYLASHDRTVTLLAKGAFDRARANYIFEESARSAALTTSIERLTDVLATLAADVASQLASDMDVAVADAQHAASKASTTIRWGVVSAVLIVAVLAVIIIGASVNRPMARITTAMRRLADGDLAVDIDANSRDDELGQMAAALGVFKSNALANKRLQEEKAAKAEAEALEVERKRKSHDELGTEIVTLVEKVTGGDFSERLSTAGRSGILAEVCKRINDLVNGLDSIIGDVGTRVEALAEGDLRQRIDKDYGGTFGVLKDNINRMADQLTGIVGQIQSATSEVKSAAAEIASGTEDLSNRTEQAASNLQETAASTEEMAATVKQNAENAKNATQLAGSADQSAKTGGDVVEQAVGAMDRIEQSARKITDIISVIDEIAFQTNLLALNASVEAARAGEAGKGFAVVAQEVRQLAQRSAQAAADIKTLIQDSNGQVKEGVELVNRAGEALNEIVGSISKVAGIVQEISGASQEQAAGVQEINGSINNMDEMTQQNSALVEQSSASARSLSDEASKLTELMAFFKSEKNKAPILPSASSPQPKTPSRPAQTPVLVAAADEEWNEF